MKYIDSQIQKGIISTPSKIEGNYKSSELIIRNSNQQNPRLREGGSDPNPASRSAYVIIFKTEPYKDEIFIPNYSGGCELITNFLSVLYGKRFDFHGMIENSGFFSLPDFSEFNSLCNPNFIFNSNKPRNDIILDLNFSALKNLETFIYKNTFSEKFNSIIISVTKFYANSLRIAEKHPDIAYLQLITALEILSSYFDYTEKDLIETDVIDTLALVEKKLDNGLAKAKKIKSLIWGVKKKFTKTILNLIDDDFFIQGDNYYIPVKKREFESTIKAAYDLRSKFTHTGKDFGDWIKPQPRVFETQAGKPVVTDKEFAKILAKAPTYLGLERIVRYCILKFMENNELKLIESNST